MAMQQVLHGDRAGHKLSSMDASSQPWLLFSYSVPKEPSTVRVALWRRLRELGAMYVAPSVCMLPDTPEGMKKLRGCMQIAEDAGGTARLIPFVIQDEQAELDLVADFSRLRAAEYAELRERVTALLDELRKEGEGGKFTFAELEENEDELEKLERWLKKIESRDILNCPDHDPSVALLAQGRVALEEFRSATIRREVDLEP